VLVSAPASATGWSTAVGPAPVAAALAALLLLAFAGLNLRANHNEMRRVSLSDELTGLPNRRLLSDRLEQALQLGTRRGTSCAVLLLGVDRFKEVNETLGHHFGDLLLREVAAGCARSCAPPTRWPGSAATSSPCCSPTSTAPRGAHALGRALPGPAAPAVRHRGRDPEHRGQHRAGPGPPGRRRRRQRPARGRHRDVRGEGPQARRRRRTSRGSTCTRPAGWPCSATCAGRSGSDELVLHYQPKVDLDSGPGAQRGGAGALAAPRARPAAARGVHRRAEGTGLILPLTLHTIELAVAQARAWYDAGSEIQVAVNLSRAACSRSTCPQAVQEVLLRTGCRRGLLRLEITESTIMTDPGRALGILTALQQSGVALSLDDFGTGYSSMSYLKRLPVDELKIDRSFVTDMLAAGSDSVLVRSSIDLGHNLGLVVVAEGVEDSQTMAALGVLGCDVVQGYHLARPMPAEALTRWLAARSCDADVPLPDASVVLHA
jgi:EAL domain-containing protein (putative c-di-GMP-specific phosphodiesterase class I)